MTDGQQFRSQAPALFDLKGRIALVTGSSRGIGFGIARGLAEAGALVVMNGRDPAKLEVACEALTFDGLKAETSVFDASDGVQVRAAVAAIENTIGPIDILVNNAGIQRRGAFEDFPEDKWHEIFAGNVDSVFHVTQAVGRHMVARRRGRIINICSIASELGRATIVPYAATKGALRQMTRGLCAEWGKHNVQINGIAPGYIRTELNSELLADEAFSAWVCARTPAGRWAEVSELAGAAIFLASDAATYVNGQILFVDGGLSASV